MGVGLSDGQYRGMGNFFSVLNIRTRLVSVYNLSTSQSAQFLNLR